MKTKFLIMGIVFLLIVGGICFLLIEDSTEVEKIQLINSKECNDFLVGLAPGECYKIVKNEK